jgi:hypothetical protein
MHDDVDFYDQKNEMTLIFTTSAAWMADARQSSREQKDARVKKIKFFGVHHHRQSAHQKLSSARACAHKVCFLQAARHCVLCTLLSSDTMHS